MNMPTTHVQQQSLSRDSHNTTKNAHTKCPFFFIRVKQIKQNAKSVWEEMNILDYCVLSFVGILMYKNEYISENGYVLIFRLKSIESPTVLLFFLQKELFSF